MPSSSTKWRLRSGNASIGFNPTYPPSFHWKIGKQRRDFPQSDEGWQQCWISFSRKAKIANAAEIRGALADWERYLPDDKSAQPAASHRQHVEPPTEPVRTTFADSSSTQTGSDQPGREVETFRFCPSCGTEAISGTTFCVICGHSLLPTPVQVVTAPVTELPPVSTRDTYKEITEKFVESRATVPDPSVPDPPVEDPSLEEIDENAEATLADSSEVSSEDLDFEGSTSTEPSPISRELTQPMPREASTALTDAWLTIFGGNAEAADVDSSDVDSSEISSGDLDSVGSTSTEPSSVLRELTRPTPRPASTAPIGAWLTIVGGITMAVSTNLAWLTATGQFGSFSQNAFQSGNSNALTVEGPVVLLLGIVTVAIGINRLRRSSMPRYLQPLKIAIAIVMTLALVHRYLDNENYANHIATGGVIGASIGIGFWLCIGGTVLAICGNLGRRSIRRHARH